MTTLKQRAIGLESSSHRIAGMKTSRLEAFSDGVLAIIIITIMVLGTESAAHG
jgi:uncharacterized membrane protein